GVRAIAGGVGGVGFGHGGPGLRADAGVIIGCELAADGLSMGRAHVDLLYRRAEPGQASSAARPRGRGLDSGPRAVTICPRLGLRRSAGPSHAMGAALSAGPRRLLAG